METELGNPIEYSPQLIDDKQIDEPIQEQTDQQFYMQPPPPPFMYPPQHMSDTPRVPDFLNSLDKAAYIVIFVAFILGFFMGKTMQPVILRPGWGG
jgi:hypothetical protein